MSKIFGYILTRIVEHNLNDQPASLNKAGCKQIFHDEFKGTNSLQPSLTALLDLIREGDMLLVEDIFHLGSSRSQVFRLLYSLQQRGIHIKILGLALDTTTSAGKIMLATLARHDEDERKNHRKKIIIGQELATAQGKHIGRPKKINSKHLIQVQQALEQKLSIIETVALTGLSRSSIKRYRNHLQKTLPR